MGAPQYKLIDKRGKLVSQSRRREYKLIETKRHSDSDLDQHYSLWWLILHMRRAMYKARAKELYRYGITPEQAAVLVTVQTLGRRATQAEISRQLLREPHSISYILHRMERGGLIKRVKDLERKNLIRITITKKGREVYLNSTRRDSIHRIMSSISDEECQRLRICLEKLLFSALKESGSTKRPNLLSSQ